MVMALSQQCVARVMDKVRADCELEHTKEYQGYHLQVAVDSAHKEMDATVQQIVQDFYPHSLEEQYAVLKLMHSGAGQRKTRLWINEAQKALQAKEGALAAAQAALCTSGIAKSFASIMAAGGAAKVAAIKAADAAEKEVAVAAVAQEAEAAAEAAETAAKKARKAAKTSARKAKARKVHAQAKARKAKAQAKAAQAQGTVAQEAAKAAAEAAQVAAEAELQQELQQELAKAEENLAVKSQAVARERRVKEQYKREAEVSTPPLCSRPPAAAHCNPAGNDQPRGPCLNAARAPDGVPLTHGLSSRLWVRLRGGGA